MSGQDFGRLLTAMVTPFTPRLEVDYDRAGELARKLVAEGNDGLVVCGTTGESPTLGTDEKIRLFRAVRAAVGDEVPMLAGTGSNNTRASVELSRAAAEAGASGLLLVAPYYNKPSQEGLYQHFKTVAESTDLPVMLYNIPGRTGVEISPETLARLAEIPQIVAVKESLPSIDPVSDLLARLRGAKVPAATVGAEMPRQPMRVYSGDDSNTLPQLAVGGHGVVSVAGHLAAGEMREMILHYLAGRVKQAQEIHLRLFPLFRGLFITSNPVPVKAALRMVGFPVGSVRAPLVEATAAEEKQIEAMLKAVGLLK
ncbi:MAG: 4-hydroxy-tetrahydrodipicolinate synthase [Armatimonadetes bacterium]|nr:4-hydroxy-tetrahydrodipicolinate synthase [Armatimonadota bacterium]